MTVVVLDNVVRGELPKTPHARTSRHQRPSPSSVPSSQRLRTAARERQGTRTDKHPAKLAEGSKGDARDKTAAFTGIKRTTLDKAEAVVAAAEAEPERFGKLKDDMDRTGRVNGVYRRLNCTASRINPRRAAAAAGPRIASSSPTRPGPTRNATRTRRVAAPGPTRRYRSKRFAELVLHRLRTTIAFCGCGPPTITCAKPSTSSTPGDFSKRRCSPGPRARSGMGDWLRGQTEHCLMAVRGKPVVTLTNQDYAATRAHARAFSEAGRVLRLR